MLNSNLITVPIRAFHYQEILCLFRKAHGPILQIQKIDPQTSPQKHKKKASLITANDTVQGFATYKNFCSDLVKMLGDGILLLNPDIYTVVIQLVFEAVSFQTKRKNQDVIYLKRITDIISPFDSPITEKLPVQSIFKFQTLQKVVNAFCMKSDSEKKLARLTERRFIPQSLKKNSSAGEQVYDNLTKLLQIQNLKEGRTGFVQYVESSRDGGDKHLKSTQMRKISHLEKVISDRFERVDTQESVEEIMERQFSAETSGMGSNRAFVAMQPKFVAMDNIQQPNLDLQDQLNIHQSAQPSVRDIQPQIEAIEPAGLNNQKYNILVDCPDSHQPKNIHQMEDSQVSFTVEGVRELASASQQRRNIEMQEIQDQKCRRNVVSRILLEKSVSENSNIEKFQPSDDSSIKLKKLMLSNNKYRKLDAKTKQLHQAEQLHKLQQFEVHRNRFDKMRVNVDNVDLNTCESVRNESSRDNKAKNTGFNIKISSRTKLEAKKDSMKPIIETLEASPQPSSEQISNNQELFDLNSMFQTKDILQVNTQSNLIDSDNDLDLQNLKKSCDETSIQQITKPSPKKPKDFLNHCKTFNRQNLQQCKLKNKRVIADNQRQQTEFLIQQGFKKCLLPPSRNHGSMNQSQRRRHKSDQVETILEQKVLTTFPLSTKNQKAAKKLGEAEKDNGYAQQPNKSHGLPLFKFSSDAPAGRQDSQNSDGCTERMQGATQIRQLTFSNQVVKPNSHRTKTTWPADRRASHNRRIMASGTLANNQQSRLRPIRSPRNSSICSAQDPTNNSTPIVKDLSAAIQCRKITTPYIQTQNRTKDAMPIRLNFFNMSMGVSPDLQFINQTNSKQDTVKIEFCDLGPPTVKKAIGAEEDGICTVRADSNLERKTTVPIIAQEENFSKIHKRVLGEMGCDISNITEAITPFGHNFTKTKLSYFSPNQQFNIQQKDSFKVQSPQNIRKNKYVTSQRTALSSGPLRISDNPDKVCGSKDQFIVNNNNKSNINSDFDGPKSQFIIADEKTQEGNVIQTQGDEISEQPQKEFILFEPPETNPGRSRQINTANTPVRISKQFRHLNQSEIKQSIEKDVQTDIMKQGVIEAKNGGLRINSTKDVLVEGSKETGCKDKGKNQYKKDFNQCDFEKFKHRTGSFGMITSNQSADPTPQTFALEGSHLSVNNYKIRKKCQKSQNELSIMSSPQRLLSSGVDIAHHIEESQDQHYQKGIYIAPRRTISRKQQKLNIKTPINMLAMYDCKGVKNLDYSYCNQDLILGSRYETETVNLSQSKSICTPEQGQRSKLRYIKSPKTQKIGQKKDQNSNFREPTPIKIVDLSAYPVPLPAPTAERKLTFKEEYERQLPLLTNRARPLKQEVLQKVTATMMMQKPVMSPLGAQSSTESRKYKHIINKDSKWIPLKPKNNINSTPSNHVMSQNSQGATSSNFASEIDDYYDQDETCSLDLRSMVTYMVKSPVTSPQDNYPLLTYDRNRNDQKIVQMINEQGLNHATMSRPMKQSRNTLRTTEPAK